MPPGKTPAKRESVPGAIFDLFLSGKYTTNASTRDMVRTSHVQKTSFGEAGAPRR
jgi:hypothetical protein